MGAFRNRNKKKKITYEERKEKQEKQDKVEKKVKHDYITTPFEYHSILFETFYKKVLHEDL